MDAAGGKRDREIVRYSSSARSVLGTYSMSKNTASWVAIVSRKIPPP